MIDIEVPEYTFPYETYLEWCKSVDYNGMGGVTYLASNQGLCITSVRLPPELALVFKLKFGL